MQKLFNSIDDVVNRRPHSRSLQQCVVATGAGAAARQSMGTGVFGGMILATFVATIFIPLFFVWLTGNHIRHHGHIDEDKK